MISVVVLFFHVPLARAAPKYRVLHAFTGGKDGGGLWGSLMLDRRHNVYGTTVAGGPKGKGGTVFKLTRRANGAWVQTVLYNFCSQSGCADGGGSTAGLIFDAAGNLYGTTTSGGIHDSGVVFELTSGSHGWTETVLYNFCSQSGCKDGGSPYAGLVMDKPGNLYGTGYAAFELSPGANGWTETALHDFTCRHNDGCEPFAGVILDSAGNLYGTTELGGSSKDCGAGCGTAYQLRPVSGGKWKETILHSFGSFKGDGVGPGVGALVMDGSGNLFGTTGGNNSGTIYELAPQSDGHWKETILYRFHAGSEGNSPAAGVVMDAAGNLYGTTVYGGTQCYCGVVYKLMPQTGGKWKYKVLHAFTGYDGAQPGANLILDSKGNLYGTTITGGAGGAGVAFELTP
jgi:uncharacterized repeat protein (TIGR03803 family)